jgi:hypothetical protein
MRAANISLVATFGCLVLAPMIAQLARFDPGRPLEENRTLAKSVTLPRSWNDAVRLPTETDDYLRDHFGLRRLALRLHDKLVWYVLRDSPSVQVTRGRHGMLFFNSHRAKYPYSLIEESCGIGLSAAAIAPVTNDVATFLRKTLRINPHSRLVVIPTKAAIYPELLPAWLGMRCRTAIPPTSVIEQQLRDEPKLMAMVDYPLDEMRAQKTDIQVYPPQAFHWAGDMPRLIAERISEKTFDLAKRRNLRVRTVVNHADLQRFIPGIDLSVEDLVPDYAAAGVNSCAGPACFPELGKFAELLGDVSRFQSADGSTKKLLLITDSFGASIAGWFSQYFSEVWHLNINYVINVSTDELDKSPLSKAIFSDYAPDYIVYLIHDAAVLSWPHQLPKQLMMDSAPAEAKVTKPPGVTFMVEPSAASSKQPFVAKVSWNATGSGANTVKIYVQESSGQETLFAQVAAEGSLNTGPWMRSGMVLRMLDADSGKLLSTFVIGSND